jgi:hypothetical protein
MYNTGCSVQSKPIAGTLSVRKRVESGELRLI